MPQSEMGTTSKKRKRPFFHTLDQTVVTIKVGPDAEPFNVHKELLCLYSSYFRGALRGCFSEAQKNTVVLPEDTVEVFRSFFCWLYTGQLRSDERNMKPSELARIYVFADKSGVSLLKNNIIDAMSARLGEQLAGNIAIDCIFKNTPPNSPMRRLLIDQYVSWADTKFFATDVGLRWLLVRPREFIAGIAQALLKLPARLKNQKTPSEIDLSQYYEVDEPADDINSHLDGSKTNAKR
ncbi:MAG: hypothetical protein M1812_008255 [Candelaria pacifica]|nr:MAG: hypothetical protein M1812_008255 [Candelaria pacifica]